MNYIDSHCHFDFSEFDSDRHIVWKNATKIGLKGLIIPGVFSDQWAQAAVLSNQYNGIYFGVGIHPWWISKEQKNAEVNKENELNPTHLEAIYRNIIAASRTAGCVAIGECGLDWLIQTEKCAQLEYFKLQLAAAKEVDKAVIIHCRKAHNEVLECLQYDCPQRGVIHAFSGSYELAMRYWLKGFHLGIGGTITYPRARKTRDAIKQLPLEAMVLETDAPDMPLIGNQGQRNSPENIPYIAKILAEIRGQPLSLIAEQTSANAARLFDLPSEL